MDSDIRKRLATAAKQLEATHPPTSAPEKPAKKAKRQRLQLGRWPSKPLVIGVVIAIIGVAVLGVLLFGRKQQPDTIPSFTVPAHIKKSVSFPVYFPDQSKMPSGYTLDQGSFSATDQAVLYSVSYGDGKKIAFTVQEKPSDDELRTFYANQLPLRHEAETTLGTAAIGVVRDQTFLSLPTKSDAWLVVTAPSDMDREKLTAIIKSLTK